MDKRKPKGMAVERAERAVLRQAIACCKYEPVNSSLVGYSKRWDRLVAAYERLTAARKKK